MQPTTRETLDRIPLKLRNEYDAAWEAYASSCRMGGTDQERARVYERASQMERRMSKAMQQAQAEHKRYLQRNAQHT